MALVLSGPACAASGAGWLENLLNHNGPANSSADPAKPREGSLKADEALLDQLAIPYPIFDRGAEETMLGAIDYYQRIVEHGGWPIVPKSHTLRRNDQDESIQVLRRHLALTDGLDPKSIDDYSYDADVESAVQRFQKRHGIPPTGIVDRRTLYALNVTAEARLAQLRINLNRLRELLAKGVPPRFVLVNEPAFELQAVSNGRLELRSRVIVGRIERPSPTVSAAIKGVNFFPYWHVPDSVAVKDIIPHMQKDPSYIDREHIRALTDWTGDEIDPTGVDWFNPAAEKIKFRQDPGTHNALGLTRIDMPNTESVYMHDTPKKELFGRATRAFSAGCVRVQSVFDLVTWLLSANGDWNRARVDSVLASGVPLDVTLQEQVPVYFVYLTAWAGPKGDVNFRPDIYDRDGSEGTVIEARDGGVVAEPMPQTGLAP